MYGFLLQLISRHRRQFTWFARNCAWFWRWLAGPSAPARWLHTWVNRLMTEYVANWGNPRPYAHSLWGPAQRDPAHVEAALERMRVQLAEGRTVRSTAPPLPVLPSAGYVSWAGLTDRSFTGRHLPAWAQSPPARVDDLAGMFDCSGDQQPCPMSSALFAFFAQWFTDSFLRTDFTDIRRNTSNHEIDLCQIYGLSAADTAILRSRQRGRLKSQMVVVDGEAQEYPPYLYDRAGDCVLEEFCRLSYIDARRRTYVNPAVLAGFDTRARRRTLFATGLERGNSTVFYAAISTIFLREHNRVAGILERANPDWDDDRLFETTRNVLIVELLKLVVQDYVGHISGVIPRIQPEPGFAETRPWYRTNHITAEFDLLYRWHALIPASVMLDGAPLPAAEFRMNNAALTTHRASALLAAATAARAGRLTLHNTQPFLVAAELATMFKARAWQLQPFNRYRELFGLEPYRSIAQLTDDPDLRRLLDYHYQGDIDRVEFVPGLLAERRDPVDIMGETMRRMVGADAFTQALTNPLLARAVYGDPLTFSADGLRVLNETNSLADVVRRNGGLCDGPLAFRWSDPGGAEEVPAPLPSGRALCVYDVPRFFIGGWRSYYLARQRHLDSPVFRVAVFQPAIACLERDAMQGLIDDPGVHQDHGFGNWVKPSMPLVGTDWPSLFENGPSHDAPKQLYRSLLDDRRSALPLVFEHHARRFSGVWTAQAAFSLRDGLEDMAMALVFDWLLDIRLDPREVAAAKALYLSLFTLGAKSWLRFLPWSRFGEYLDTHRALIGKVQASAVFREFILPQAVRLDMRDGQTVAEQICFVVGMNAFLGIQNHLKSMVAELALHPELHASLRHELAEAAGGADDRDGLALRLAGQPGIESFLREVLRLHPPVTLVYGRATADRVVRAGGRRYRVRAGELMVGVTAIIQRDPQRFPSPDEFRPSRWQEGARPEDLIWSRGGHCDAQQATDRRCPGRDDALTCARLAMLWLLGNHSWSLAATPRWDFRCYGINLAAPKGDLAVVDFRRRSPDSAAAPWWAA